MPCRIGTDDPRRCDGCGEFLWVSDEGWYCGACGVTMPCTMRILPPASVPTPPTRARRGEFNPPQI